eukprot:TRINITY_DN6048_c0_g1_i2.p2 TRINITY_DN6048_c0_g1~~TRINITY_DN6048_c0_g1_i2.p2  ORF type:complete len:283 (+),score=12.72 TRINITY_DN6048_c0_g1_i2:136-984(+)
MALWFGWQVKLTRPLPHPARARDRNHLCPILIIIMFTVAIFFVLLCVPAFMNAIDSQDKMNTIFSPSTNQDLLDRLKMTMTPHSNLYSSPIMEEKYAQCLFFDKDNDQCDMEKEYETYIWTPGCYGHIRLECTTEGIQFKDRCDDQCLHCNRTYEPVPYGCGKDGINGVYSWSCYNNPPKIPDSVPVEVFFAGTACEKESFYSLNSFISCYVQPWFPGNNCHVSRGSKCLDDGTLVYQDCCSFKDDACITNCTVIRLSDTCYPYKENVVHQLRCGFDASSLN